MPISFKSFIKNKQKTLKKCQHSQNKILIFFMQIKSKMQKNSFIKNVPIQSNFKIFFKFCKNSTQIISNGYKNNN